MPPKRKNTAPAKRSSKRNKSSTTRPPANQDNSEASTSQTGVPDATGTSDAPARTENRRRSTPADPPGNVLRGEEIRTQSDPNEILDSQGNQRDTVNDNDDIGTQQHTWANSTSIPVSAQNQMYDPSVRFAEVLERTLNSVREASLSENNSRLVNRLTTAKSLPSFSGDPLEWLHFKETYELSSESGAYSDRENMTRLFQALKGEARDVVKTLLATSRDANAVIRTLQLHYGNKKTVAEKIVKDLNNIPSIDSGNITLTQFATKFQNAILAFKSLGLTGYLHSPEISRLVGSKLPSALKYAYNRYAATEIGDKSELEKLGEFLYKEAELAAAAGIFDVEVATTADESKNKNNRYDKRSGRSNAVYVAHEASESGERHANHERVYECGICMHGKHFPSECASFKRESLEKRWVLAKKHRLCFGCLKFGHPKRECRNAKCSKCGKSHHSLLHREAGTTQNSVANQMQNRNRNNLARVNVASKPNEFSDNL